MPEESFAPLSLLQRVIVVVKESLNLEVPDFFFEPIFWLHGDVVAKTVNVWATVCEETYFRILTIHLRIKEHALLLFVLLPSGGLFFFKHIL